MPLDTVPLLDSFSALADATRCRLLLVLEQQELTVSELCVVLQLPQSTVSRHLKTLSDVGLVTSRRDGTSKYYTPALDQPHAALWQLARPEFLDRPGATQDARRLERVLSARRATSQKFFATSAGQWDRLRDELFGADFYVRPLLGLLPDSWVVGDLGCGTGAIVAALAAHVGSVIGVDASDEMLKAAARRLANDFADVKNVQLRQGVLEALPLQDAMLDAATLVLVLHHLAAPAVALSEAFRVLKPGGRLLIVDMAPHEREEYRQQMGHVWLGFSEEQIRRLIGHAGFSSVRVHALPAVTEARGPGLFAATGEKGEAQRSKHRT
jgi:ubiquinone/menaquinone biosynthesis C-methylase UbiE/DNA-binding transcriptional ArsR family regulator